MDSFIHGTVTKDIYYLVVELAKARRQAEREKKALADVERAIENHYGRIRNIAKDALSVAREQVAGLEDEVRQAGLEKFNSTGDKQVHPAVQIKEYTTLEYDAGEALDYAREHIPGAVKLDKREFDKAAKVLNLEFVEIGSEPRATIARDLKDYE